MKKLLFILAALFISTSLMASERSFKMIYRDYWFDDIMTNSMPLSAGVVLWENKELPDHVGVYGSVALFTYKDFLRLECGGIGVWNEKKDRVEIGMLTGVSARVWKRLVVGAWYAPFWNTYGENPDDPWGIMVGYAFNIGK